MKAKRKQSNIEYVIFDGSNFKECEEFIGKENYDNTVNYPNIRINKSTAMVVKDDYIIKEDTGSLWLCNKESFEENFIDSNLLDNEELVIKFGLFLNKANLLKTKNVSDLYAWIKKFSSLQDYNNVNDENKVNEVNVSSSIGTNIALLETKANALPDEQMRLSENADGEPMYKKLFKKKK